MNAASESRRPVRDPREFGKVAVLLGGDSAEREISLMTGKAVLRALRSRDIDAHAWDPAEAPLTELLAHGFDRSWIALHGRGGEDGTMQGALQLLGMPYTGSGVLGCALAMDKFRSKRILEASGLPTPEFEVLVSIDQVEGLPERLGLPLVIKPSREGSSVGMTKVVEAGQLEAAWETARACDACVIAEKWVIGGEYTAAVLQGEVLPMIRIETPREFYDYEAKYFSDTTRYFCPAGLDAAVEQALAVQASQAFDVIGGSGWGRVDFMLDEDGSARFLEVNTVPGMTDHSLVPMAARQAGIDFEELVWRILETSFVDADQSGDKPGGSDLGA